MAGRERWVLVRVTSARLEVHVGALVQHLDITERFSRERFERVSMLAAEQMGRATGILEFFGRIVPRIGEVTDWPAVILWRAKGASAPHPCGGWCEGRGFFDVMGGSVELGDTVAAATVASAETSWVPQLSAGETALVAELTADTVAPRAAFGVYRGEGGGCHSTVVFYSPVACRPDGPYLDLVERLVASPLVGTLPEVHEGGGVFSAADGQEVTRGRFMEQVRRAAGSDAPVLLLGEEGTGKAHIARKIHESSARRGHPFLAVDCKSAEPGSLEVQLFGYEGGIIPQVPSRGPGYLEIATGGTVLLENVGFLHISLQDRLLRVLESHRFQRLGGTTEMGVNVRFMATATPDTLQELLLGGGFREALFYRLNVLAIRLLPLRQRLWDLERLCHELLEEDFPEPVQPRRITPDAMWLLQEYGWPGNVRELREVLSRVSSGAGTHITASDVLGALPVRRYLSGSQGQENPAARKLRERKRIESALVRTRCNVRKAARLLGMARSTLYLRLRELDIDVQTERRRLREPSYSEKAE